MPQSQNHRVMLNVRCEMKGGQDEYTTKSCCDHLNPAQGDRDYLGGALHVCGDEPTDVVNGLRSTFKNDNKCD